MCASVYVFILVYYISRLRFKVWVVGARCSKVCVRVFISVRCVCVCVLILVYYISRLKLGQRKSGI